MKILKDEINHSRSELPSTITTTSLRSAFENCANSKKLESCTCRMLGSIGIQNASTSSTHSSASSSCHCWEIGGLWQMNSRPSRTTYRRTRTSAALSRDLCLALFTPKSSGWWSLRGKPLRSSTTDLSSKDSEWKTLWSSCLRWKCDNTRPTLASSPTLTFALSWMAWLRRSSMSLVTVSRSHLTSSKRETSSDTSRAMVVRAHMWRPGASVAAWSRPSGWKDLTLRPSGISRLRVWRKCSARLFECRNASKGAMNWLCICLPSNCWRLRSLRLVKWSCQWINALQLTKSTRSP